MSGRDFVSAFRQFPDCVGKIHRLDYLAVGLHQLAGGIGFIASNLGCPQPGGDPPWSRASRRDRHFIRPRPMRVARQDDITIGGHRGSQARAVRQLDVEFRSVNGKQRGRRIGRHTQRTNGAFQIDWPKILAAIPAEEIGRKGVCLRMHDGQGVVAEGDFLAALRRLAIQFDRRKHSNIIPLQYDGKLEPRPFHRQLMLMESKQGQHQQQPPEQGAQHPPPIIRAAFHGSRVGRVRHIQYPFIANPEVAGRISAPDIFCAGLPPCCMANT